MAVLTLRALPVRSLRDALSHHGSLLSALSIGVLGGLVTLFCQEWRLPESNVRLSALSMGVCIWLLAALATFLQEERTGRIAAGLMASCPLLVFFACWGAAQITTAALGLTLALLAAHLRWAGRRYLILPITLALAVTVLREPAVGLALTPLVVWGTARVPFYQRLTALGVLLLAWWSLALPIPGVALLPLTGGQRLQRVLFLAIAALPLGIPALLVGLPRLSRLTRLVRDERARFLLLALVPGLVLLVLGGPREALLLTLTPLYLLLVALTLGESRESWPEAATAALIVGNAALLLWPLPAARVAEGWPGLVTLRQETEHWLRLRDAVLRTAPRERTLLLTLPAEQGRLVGLLPGYRIVALGNAPRALPVGTTRTFLVAGRRLSILRDTLGLQLMDRTTGRTRRMAMFVPARIEALPGTDGDVWRVETEEARTLRLGEELLLTR
jgi:hypothetical protein